eukprot:scaffold13856_cov54-Phaeocystis_antarctica.AAC.1
MRAKGGRWSVPARAYRPELAPPWSASCPSGKAWCRSSPSTAASSASDYCVGHEAQRHPAHT